MENFLQGMVEVENSEFAKLVAKDVDKRAKELGNREVERISHTWCILAHQIIGHEIF